MTGSSIMRLASAVSVCCALHLAGVRSSGWLGIGNSRIAVFCNLPNNATHIDGHRFLQDAFWKQVVTDDVYEQSTGS
jgi:hypothetical protein